MVKLGSPSCSRSSAKEGFSSSLSVYKLSMEFGACFDTKDTQAFERTNVGVTDSTMK